MIIPANAVVRCSASDRLHTARYAFFLCSCVQAQDRAHRIGQTKPVQVYRLITQGSVEEKMIERAMIKLKLDAVVVQQGRLSDKSKAVSKEEMMEMIQFGANAVFKSGG